jgi:uncharacterized protein YbjT (DUF2867 family)
MKMVLVCGASGYLGRYVVLEFKKRGYSVRALVRDPEKLKHRGALNEPAIHDVVDEIFQGDVTIPETLIGACYGVDLVFSSIGLTHKDGDVIPEQVDHMGNRNLLSLALKANVSKFIYVSVFNAKHIMKSPVVKAHERFVDDLKSSYMNYTVIRSNGFFSDMATIQKIARKKGFMVWIGDGQNRFNPVHGADLAKVCVDAAEGNATEIDVGGPEMFTYRSLFELAFESLGKKPRIIFIPIWIGKAVSRVIRLFNPEFAVMLSILIEMNSMDNSAPAYGTHRLEDFYQELAQQT